MCLKYYLICLKTYLKGFKTTFNGSEKLFNISEQIFKGFLNNIEWAWKQTRCGMLWELTL